MNDRDQFAKAALPALIAGSPAVRDHAWATKHAIDFAELAYVFADAMLDVREAQEQRMARPPKWEEQQ